MEQKGRKQLAFDLDTNALVKYYPSDNWRNAYEDIKKYLIENGFSWKQGSVYESTNTINFYEISQIVKNLVVQNNWLNICMRDCVVSNIEKRHTLNHLFDKNMNVPSRNSYQIPLSTNDKQHIKELKRNGFQPSKDIVKKMQQLDTFSGKYVGLKEIRDIFKGEKSDISFECKKLADDIGKNLREQETIHVSYL